MTTSTVLAPVKQFWMTNCCQLMSECDCVPCVCVVGKYLCVCAGLVSECVCLVVTVAGLQCSTVSVVSHFLSLIAHCTIHYGSGAITCYVMPYLAILVWIG